jgi:Protein of unknown function (DUF3307)
MDEPGGNFDWPAAFMVFAACHLAGDFLLQTEWQAVNKRRGLDDPQSRQALLQHVAAYTSSFAPALVWVARRRGPVRALTAAASIAIPHVAVDEGRIVEAWLRSVKRAPHPPAGLAIAVDQSFHALCLLWAARVATRARSAG